VGLLAGAWLGVLLVLQWRHVRPPAVESSAELLVIGLVGVAAATVLFRLGDHEPGAIVAPMVVVLGLGLVFVESLVGSPVYLTGAEPSLGRTSGWCAAAALALLTIVVAGSERTTPRRRRQPARPRRPGGVRLVSATPRGGADRPPG
jgi:hypothetical protein